MTEREFRERVLSLRRLMYGVALKMGIPPDDAADAVQEALVKLWRHRDGIPENPGESRLYCMAALRNECLSLIRRRPPASAASAGIPLEEAADVKASPDNDTGLVAEYNDTRRHIEILIDTLPPGQRDAIRMSGFGGLDNSEIAEATGQTENNVRQLLSRGRRRLRELLEINGL